MVEIVKTVLHWTDSGPAYYTVFLFS